MLWRRWIIRQTLQNCGELSIDGELTPNAENDAITFDDSLVSFPKQIANYFNRQFTTSKLGRHAFPQEIRLVSREIRRKSLTSAVTFTTDQVSKGINSCSNSRAFEPDKLSILHLKYLGPRGIEFLFNDSVTSCRIPSIWKSSIVILIPKPGQGLLSQHFLSAYLAPLSSSESYGGSLTSNRQQPAVSIRRPTRFPTRILYHF